MKTSNFRDLEGTGAGVGLLALRVLFGGLMVAAGFAKLRAPLQFALGIQGFDLLPAALLPITAFIVPWLEIVAGAHLVVGRWTREAALVMAGTLGVFTLAVISVILRGKHVECGCFGDMLAALKPLIPSLAPLFDAMGGAKISGVTVARNCVFLSGFIALAIFGAGRFSLDALARRRAQDHPAPEGRGTEAAPSPT